MRWLEMVPKRAGTGFGKSTIVEHDMTRHTTPKVKITDKRTDFTVVTRGDQRANACMHADMNADATRRKKMQREEKS